MGDFFAGMGLEAAGTGVLLVLLVSILGLVMRSIVKGDLITKTQHDREVSARDAEFERMVKLKDGTIERLKGEKDDWRDAYRASDARGDVLSEQVKDLVAEQRTFNRFMESLTSVVNRGGQT